MESVISYLTDKERLALKPPRVDEWTPSEEDIIFKNTKGAMILPVSKFYNIEETKIDYFILSGKRCYNGLEMREHNSLYMNYFEKFYDKDKELLSIYCKIKYLLDYYPEYSKEALFYDLKRYILDSPTIITKIYMMNKDNYIIKNFSYTNKTNIALRYTDYHCMLLMEMSLLMNAIIPLLTHFMYVKSIQDPNTFLLEIFDHILHRYNVDIYSKLYETTVSIISKSEHDDAVLWQMQSIRGKNPTTHAIASVNNIILNIMPKYRYDSNIISLNLTSIKKNTSFQIVDISYEFDFISLSSSKRDEDNNSEFDKFESFLVKRNEALYIQNKVNSQETMKTIDKLYGPFDQDEIDFYINNLYNSSTDSIINNFQKSLVFNLFYKYFGNPESINAINKEDYVKLIISAKRILEANNMIILPYIISGKIERLVSRNNVNKKEFTKLEQSPYYTLMVEKYKNEKIVKYVLYLIATILCSEFRIIEYHDNPEQPINGLMISSIPDIICEEVLMYVSLI